MADSGSSAQVGVQEGETPSPLCNHLLEQARLRLKGQLSEDELREGVGTALASLEQAREQTIGNLENNGADEAVIDAFERSFEEMQIALEDLDDFASNATEDNHENVRASLIRAASATVFAMTALQQAQYQDGPSDMPLFNALFRMKEGYLEGGVDAASLQQALSGIVEMTKKAIEELLQAEGEQPPQRDGLVRAYEEQIESLELVDKTVEAGDKSRLNSVFEKLLVTSNQVKEAMGSLNLAMMSVGPCRLSRTNVLLSAADTFYKGAIGPEVFAEAIEAFESHLREERDAFQEMTVVPNTSQAVQQEVEGARAAYEMHEDALALFSEVLEGETEPADFEKAKKLLIKASEKLSDHREALIEIGENEGKVSCVRCGTKNEPGSKVCISCGAQLPQQASMASSTLSVQENDGAAVAGGELVITSNLEKLFNAVNAIDEGRSTDEEFEAVLVWMDGLLTNAQATMPEVPDLTPPSHFEEDAVKNIELVAEDLHEQRDLMLAGMAEFQAALGTLQSYFETRTQETLIRGVQEVRNAAMKMQQSEKALAFITDSVKAAQKAADESESASES